MESGLWFVIKNFSGIVSEGFRLATDSPRIPKLRFDPDGEKKAEERREHNRRISEAMRASGIPEVKPDPQPGYRIPPLKSIHLQSHDPEYDVWRDECIMIDLEKIRIHHCPSYLLGRQREGSGALGVMLFSAPILLFGAPYIFGKKKMLNAREGKLGMSRHAIALMKELDGKLDEADEAMLQEALQNEWLLEQKMHQEVSLEEACAVLDDCRLVEKVWEDDELGPKVHAFDWYDDRGDLVGEGNIEDDQHYCLRVLSTEFADEEAAELMRHYKTRETK